MNIKTKLVATSLFILLLLSNTAHTFAQMRVGITAGTRLSTLIRDSQINKFGGRVGYLAAASMRLSLGDLGWFVKSGVTYTLEGDSQQPLNFISVPLVLGIDVSDDVSIFVAYDLAWQVGNANNVQDFYNTFANLLGLGSEVKISEKFALGSRLNYGLSNLVSVPTGARNFTIKPLTFDLYLTYFVF